MSTTVSVFRPRALHVVGWALFIASGASYAGTSPAVGTEVVNDVGARIIGMPLPTFAPRASATTLICTPGNSVSVRGLNEGKSDTKLPGPTVDTMIYPGRAYGQDQKTRLTFGAGVLKVSLGAMEAGRVTWGPDFDYRVLNDAPEDFTSIRVGSGERGTLQTLVINRVTGTAITTQEEASLPMGGHPSISAWFMTCEPPR